LENFDTIKIVELISDEERQQNLCHCLPFIAEGKGKGGNNKQGSAKQVQGIN